MSGDVVSTSSMLTDGFVSQKLAAKIQRILYKRRLAYDSHSTGFVSETFSEVSNLMNKRSDLSPTTG